MRASLRALSLAAVVSSATGAGAAPSLWDGGLLPEEPRETTVIRTTIGAAPSVETSDRGTIRPADVALTTQFLWDGGLLPEQLGVAPIARAAVEVSSKGGAGSSDIDETYVSLADEELLASIGASIERELRGRFVFLLDHEGEGSSPVGHVWNYTVSADAEPDWAAIDQLPGAGDLAGLVVPGRKFLVEDEDDLPDVRTASLISAEVSGDSGQSNFALDGYEDR